MNRIRYKHIDNSLFHTHRQNLYKHLPSNALVVLYANNIMPTNGDGVFPYKQNSDLFYFTGIDQANTILMLYPDAKENKHKEILFIQKTNSHTAIWEGTKYTIAQAQKTSAIENIQWIDNFKSILHSNMLQAEHIYLNTNEHARATHKVLTNTDLFITWCKKSYPLHQYKRLAPIMQKLRMVKLSPEIDLIQKACDITAKAFKHVLPQIKPGIQEYAIEANLLSTLIQHGSRNFAYNPIIASGKNTCILHYDNNNNILKKGSLLLMDIGAEYANYNADVTRVVPIGGKFSPRQKEVYQAVLYIMDEAKKMLTVGSTLREYHQNLAAIITDQLIKIRLLSKHDVQKQNKNNPLYKHYCMHSISHYLGLDVHDVGCIDEKLMSGMVLTIEPGIYIPKEEIGIRLENNVVIQDNRVQDLTSDIPLAIENIEAYMHT